MDQPEFLKKNVKGSLTVMGITRVNGLKPRNNSTLMISKNDMPKIFIPPLERGMASFFMLI